jgi:L-alanine-DL-glutamate epimerase-like enolase superfamily enzyme
MRIREIRLYEKLLPVIGGIYRMSKTAVSSLDSTIVELVADSGLSGWGETCPVGPVYQPHHALGARAALQQMLPGLLDVDEISPRRIAKAMDERLSGHGYAKAAVDIAVLDLLGKAHRLRVCELLGGALTERIPSYYSTIVGDPNETARIAREKRDEGYPRLQVKIAGKALAEDIEIIRKVWEAVGSTVRLQVDANRGMKVADAITVSNQCADIPFIFEQPCNTLDEILMLRGRLCHPVFCDENTEDLNALLRIVSLGAADGFGLKVTRLGGLSAMATARDVCALRSLPHSCDDAWGGDIIAAACVHIAATVEPRLLTGAWIAAPYIEGHYDAANPITVTDGHIRLPTEPGLGVEPDRRVFGKPTHVFGT